jgi:hypothetical protein
MLIAVLNVFALSLGRVDRRQAADDPLPFEIAPNERGRPFGTANARCSRNAWTTAFTGSP